MTRAKSNELESALQAYLSAIDVDATQLPLEDPVDVLVEALTLGAQHAHGFVLLDLSEAPYPGLAAGDPSAPWRMQWAIQVAELEAFTCPAMEDTLFLVDTVADPSGKHRVYTAEDGLRGDLEFEDISQALQWMAARVTVSAGGKKATLQAATKKYARLLDDAWEDDARSGWNVFESFMDSGFTEAWDALSRGGWPVLDGPLAPPPTETHPALGRATLAWATERFVRERRVELPDDFDIDELSGVHHGLLEQLRELEGALHTGRLPSAIAAGCASDDDLLQELAGAWKARFEGAQRSLRASARKTAPARKAATPAKSSSTAKGTKGKVDVTPIRRAGKAQREAAAAAARPADTDLGGLDELAALGLDDLGALAGLDDLDLGDLDSDEEFAALERELGASNAALEPPPAPRSKGKTAGVPPKTKAGKPERAPAASKAKSSKGKASPPDADPLGGLAGDLGGLGGALRALLGGGPGAEEVDDEPEDVEMTPFNQKLMAALDALLDRMEADEVIEIIPERKQMLVREMVRAASDARSPKHMLSSLTRALVDSEQIEEIYATDDQIQRLLRGALGG
ncbi:MAG: hypothetical protein R3B40_28480 [Polyangiales bacterium]